jgi:transposase
MQGNWLIMSKKERKRKVILEDVVRGRMRLKEAAPHLGVSYRQAKRQVSKYKALGDAGLVHGNRGKAPGCSLNVQFKQQVLDCYEKNYMGFGPTFAAEKLLERNKLRVNHETLRLWLLANNLWKRHRKHKIYRQRREARQCFGELVQIDGSDHHWFGKETDRCCLLNMVDDATSKTLSQLAGGETSEVLLRTFRWWVERYGVPCAVYVDFKNIYISAGRRKDGEWQKVLNAFERVCKLLGVEIIGAYTAQAKGRVERNHGVYQDRFVKELQLRDVKTVEEANRYLKDEYLEKINARFEKEAASKVDAHCSVKAFGDLDQIFCWAYEREIRQDWTVQFKKKHYQVERISGKRVKPKDRIEVRRHLDGNLSFWKGEKKLVVQVLQERPKPKAQVGVGKREKKSPLNQESGNGSPWRRYNPNWMSPKKGVLLAKTVP